MTMDLNETGKERLGTAINCCSIAVMAAALRFWCKISSKHGIHAEDWWILAVMPIYIGATADDIWGLLRGSNGQEIGEITAELLRDPSPEKVQSLGNFLKAQYIDFFPLAICAYRCPHLHLPPISTHFLN
ncbi:hypothetical protein GGR52DRAFT_523669 [Hypoxylon sp. FL1284]|nr:hypothetical protein GGR52DRAFT_523669 [Hypoxylon sp. FL1284]